MRFVPILILFIIIAFLPSIAYGIKSYRRYHKTTAKAAIAYIFSFLSLLWFIVVNYMAKREMMDFRVLEWTIWSMLLIYVSSNIYAIFYIIYWIITRIWHKKISLIKWIGTILSWGAIIVLMTGMILRHNVKVREVTIESADIPTGFDGKKIVQITDLHLGNLTPQQKYLDKIVNIIKDIEPDVLLFTGDLVNIKATDAEGTEGTFECIDAPLGRYAITGNHDYGDYCKWSSEEAKRQNLEDTYNAFREIGFILLNDSSLYLKSGNDSIGLIGIENWGADPFPKYGNLADAVEGWEPAAFNILLTHDPSHWQQEVIKEYKYIDLSLSGHTHGGQFGIKIGKKKISPSMMAFKYWDGLYKEGEQQLFVSSGLGYVGIPFRLGMPPEIVVLTLKQKKEGDTK